jgi:hypothetical protein
MVMNPVLPFSSRQNASGSHTRWWIARVKPRAGYESLGPADASW